MTIEDLKKHKRVLILGYGVSGRATEEFFERFLPDVEIIIADQKDDPDYLQKQDEVELVIKGPGIKKKDVYKPFTTLVDIYLTNTSLTTIGITGTKGKSTVSSLLKTVFDTAHINSFLLGNIGEWDTDALLPNQTGYAIFELSSYQLDDIKLSPHIAVFLNIYTENHTHQSFDAYFEAKTNITRYQNDSDYFIFSPNFKLLQTLSSRVKSQVIPIDSNIELKTNNKSLRGKHNLLNMQAVNTICKLLNINDTTIQKGFDQFVGLPHRLEYVGNYSGIEFYNDSASNNPASTVGALSAFDKVQTLIVGGQNREFEFDELVDAICEHNVENLVVFRDTGQIILQKLEEKKYKLKHIFETDSMSEAVKWAYKHTNNGGVCLLSPGAPSYLQYKNFPQRGEDFVTRIKDYEKQEEIS